MALWHPQEKKNPTKIFKSSKRYDLAVAERKGGNLRREFKNTATLRRVGNTYKEDGLRDDFQLISPDAVDRLLVV